MICDVLDTVPSKGRHVTPALHSFASQLEKRGLNPELRFMPGPPARITIPAKNTATGGVLVYDDSCDVTVELQGKHHSHFSTPREAADFVADLITERIGVTVDYLGDRCIGSSDFQLEKEGFTVEALRNSPTGLTGGNVRSERFLWSGPVDTKRT